EREFAGELHNSWIAGGGESAEVRGVQTRTWRTEIDPIDDVKYFPPELQRAALPDGKATRQSHVVLEIRRVGNRVRMELAISSGRRRREGPGVQIIGVGLVSIWVGENLNCALPTLAGQRRVDAGYRRRVITAHPTNQ